ncbi:MAG: hypothetical protein ACI9LM_001386 [Alteromonadaceae bacterium]|jgi:hypothetical protein
MVLSDRHHGITHLEKEVKDINQIMISLGNSVLSNQNINDQIEKLIIREDYVRGKILAIEQKILSISLDKEKLKTIKTKLDKIDINQLKQEIKNKHSEIRAEILLSASKNSREQMYGLLGIILSVFGLSGGLAFWGIKQSVNENLKKQLYEHDKNIEKQISVSKVQHQNVLNEESFKRALVYTNIAISIYQTRFTGTGNGYIKSPKVNKNKADLSSVLLEVIAIQKFSVEQVKELLNTYTPAKSLFSETSLNLAYYVCELKLLVGEIEEDAEDMAHSLLDDSNKFESDWIKREFNKYETNKDLEGFYERVIDYKDSKEFISLVLGRKAYSSSDIIVEKILNKSKDTIRSNDNYNQEVFTSVSNKMKSELVEIYKKIIDDNEGR